MDDDFPLLLENDLDSFDGQCSFSHCTISNIMLSNSESLEKLWHSYLYLDHYSQRYALSICWNNSLSCVAERCLIDSQVTFFFRFRFPYEEDFHWQIVLINEIETIRAH